MTAVYILLAVLGILLGILLLLLFLPVGVRVRYDRGGFYLALVLGPIRWQLLPDRGRLQWLLKRLRKKAPAKKHAAPAKKTAAPAPQPQRTGGSLEGLKAYIPTCLALLDAIRRRLLMRRLELLVKLGGEDPCDLARDYGRTCAAVGSAIPLLERAFRIRRRDVQVFCDFTAETTEVYLNMEITACPARILAVSLRYGCKLYEIHTQEKLKSKKAVQ